MKVKKVGKFFLILILMSVFSNNYAGLTDRTLIKGLVWTDPKIHPKEGVEVWLVNATNAGINECLNRHTVVLLLSDDPRFHEKYHTLLAAYLSRKQVRIYSNECVIYGNYPYGIVQSIVMSEDFL